MTHLIGKILSNRYEIVSIIGIGGMATVYEGKDLLLNRMVAIKILKSEFNADAEFIKKFRQESQAAAKLSHPNIVNIYDVGVSDDIYYIIMELVKGSTLKEFLNDVQGNIREDALINISLQIASALQEAHAKDVIHRDIKAQNILVNDQGNIKVADFGIARAATASTATLVNTKEIIGSVHYSSPEQARGGFVDARSDIYSLGILLYELATKTLPFEAESPVAVALQQIKDEIPDIRLIRKDLSEGLNAIINKMTQKSPSDRYQNTAALIADLKALKENKQFALPNAMQNADHTIVMPRITDEAIKAHERQSKALPETVEQKGVGAWFKNLFEGKPLNIALVLVGAFTLALMIFGIFTLGRVKTLFETPVVTVPMVENKSVEEATKILTDLGLVVDATEHQSSSKVQENYVIDQSLDEGQEVKKGFTIELIISTGAKDGTVPDVKQQKQEEAISIIESNGYVVGKITEAFDDLPAGMVVDQSPRSNTDLKEGSAIDLVISKGPKEVKYLVPSVKGMTIKNAEEALSKLGFKLGNIEKEYSDEEKGTIIAQSYMGAEMPSGTVVDIVISDGVKPEEAKPEEPTGGDTTGTEPSTGGDTSGQLVQKTSAYVIDTTKFEADSAVVRIEFTQGDKVTVVYSKEHFKSEGLEINVGFTIKGTGEGKIVVYYDEKVAYEEAIKF